MIVPSAGDLHAAWRRASRACPAERWPMPDARASVCWASGRVGEWPTPSDQPTEAAWPRGAGGGQGPSGRTRNHADSWRPWVGARTRAVCGAAHGLGSRPLSGDAGAPHHPRALPAPPHPALSCSASTTTTTTTTARTPPPPRRRQLPAPAARPLARAGRAVFASLPHPTLRSRSGPPPPRLLSAGTGAPRSRRRACAPPPLGPHCRPCPSGWLCCSCCPSTSKPRPPTEQHSAWASHRPPSPPPPTSTCTSDASSVSSPIPAP